MINATSRNKYSRFLDVNLICFRFVFADIMIACFVHLLKFRLYIVFYFMQNKVIARIIYEHIMNNSVGLQVSVLYCK